MITRLGEQKLVDVVAVLAAAVAGFVTMLITAAVLQVTRPLINMSVDALTSGLSSTASLLVALVVTYLLVLRY